MEKKIIKSDIFLLPNYFKKIGLGIIAISIFIALGLKFLSPEYYQLQKVVIKIFFQTGIFFGLTVIVLSKDKIEDELINIIRLRAFVGSFMGSIFYVIFSPFIDLLFRTSIQEILANRIIFFMLGFYLLFFYFLKKGR